MSLVQNERAKLTATYVNGVAVALAAAGAIAPWIGFVQGANLQASLVALSSTICLIVSLGLHVVARAYLGRMREP